MCLVWFWQLGTFFLLLLLRTKHLSLFRLVSCLFLHNHKELSKNEKKSPKCQIIITWRWPCEKSKCQKDMSFWVGCGRTWPHPALEHWLLARPHHPPSVVTSLMAEVLSADLRSQVPKHIPKPSQKNGGGYITRWLTPIRNESRKLYFNVFFLSLEGSCLSQMWLWLHWGGDRRLQVRFSFVQAS